jgi:DNA polymerase
MNPGADRSDAVRALAWQIAVGIDEAVGDEPIDRLNRPADKTAAPPIAQEIAAPMRAMPVAAPSPMETPFGTPAVTAAARDLAAAANTLDELKDAIANFEGLGLKATATNLVFADGNPQAPLMLIGEAPGAEEDRRALPFVGASGQLLDRMLAAIGRDRSNCYITNIVNWRPPGNRKPSPAEMAMSLPFISRHIALVNPAVILLLGDTAAKTLTGRSEGITRLRGRWHDLAKPDSAETIPTLPSFHPAFLLRSPAQKREAWTDLLAIKARLTELGF